jgi:small subunit ribosomal protein S16
MPVRIRLQRHGKKGSPFYWIVAADSRTKRDGKYLEKLGTYNPNTNPAQIELNIEGAVKWLKNGAQPSETTRRILSYKGAMLKYHLLGGVAKGALTQEQAEEKFQNWLEEKTKKVAHKKDNLAKAKSDAKAKTLKAEKQISEKRKVVVEGVVESPAPVAEAPVEEDIKKTAESSVEDTEKENASEA